MPVGVFDQTVEHRVVENGPPLVDIGVVLAEPFVGRVDPILLDRRRRPAVVRANLESVVNVLGKACAANQLRQRYHQRQPAAQGASRERPSSDVRAVTRVDWHSDRPWMRRAAGANGKASLGGKLSSSVIIGATVTSVRVAVRQACQTTWPATLRAASPECGRASSARAVCHDLSARLDPSKCLPGLNFRRLPRRATFPCQPPPAGFNSAKRLHWGVRQLADGWELTATGRGAD